MSLSLDVVDQVTHLDALQQEWNAAAEASSDPNVFLTWEWLWTWWRHFGEHDPGSRLHVVVIRDDQGLVAAAPLFRRRRGKAPVRAITVQPVAFDAGDYGGVILVRRHEEAVALLVRHLEHVLRRDVSTITLSRLPSDGRFLATLRTQVPGLEQDGRLAVTDAMLADSVCPYIDVTDGYDLTKPLKKNRVPQRLRRMSEKYEVELRYHTGEDLEAGLDHLVELHRLRWADRQDEFKGLLASRSGEAFLLDAVRALDTRGWQRLLTLLADGRPVATRLDFEFAGRIYMLKNAIDPAFSEFGPGHITHHRAIEDGLARGVTEFDFLRGDHPYKRRWSNRERHLVTVTLCRSGLRGHVAKARSRLAHRMSVAPPPFFA